MHILIFFSFFLFTSLLKSHPLIFEANRLDFDFSISSFTTNSNYEVGENSFSNLTNNQSFQNTLFNFQTRYGFNSKLAILGSLRGAYSKSVGATYERVSSGLTDLSIGVDYLFFYHHFLLSLEGFGLFPFFQIDPNTDEVLLSEGSTDFGLKTNIGKNWNRTLLYGYLGLTSQSEGRATLVPWGIMSKYRGDFWIFEGGLKGYHNLGNDKTNALEKKTVTDRVDGGSLHFYSVNPKFIEATLSAGMQIQPQFHILLGYSKSLTGEATANGSSIMISFHYSFGETPAQRMRRLKNQKLEERSLKNIKNFEIPSDKTDLELFEEEEEKMSNPEQYQKILKKNKKEIEKVGD